MGSFAHVVGAKSASWRSGVCDAIHPCYNSPYAVACVFSSNHAHCISPPFQIAPIANRPMLLRVFFLKSPILQITHVTIHPHVEGLIAISPYTGVIRTFANIRVNTQKRHHGHGVSMFAHVVGAICKSPTFQITHVPNHPCSKLLPLQIAHVTIHPHVEGLIAISPYTCVY